MNKATLIYKFPKEETAEQTKVKIDKLFSIIPIRARIIKMVYLYGEIEKNYTGFIFLEHNILNGATGIKIEYSEKK